MRQLQQSTIFVRPCSEDDIAVLEDRLGLRLPDAYKEFLRWTGSGGELFGGYRFKVTNVPFNREDAIETLHEDSSSEVLPEDAIVCFLQQGGYAFAFIRASEGVDPPVHYYLPVRTSPNSPLESKIVWNHSSNLEEFCLEKINWFIKVSS
ncbi:SMI1/KNR4 family protein [Leptolyngbya sp. AN02str]|uniref:SMI1/KNR4 family protein n=1 Tax=Leptolyngbya sp. AN02str TaxID=3423363 RepID=UPI003D314230